MPLETVVLDALQTMGNSCVQMDLQGNVCGEQSDVGIVNQPNLVCDRFLVGTCPVGHHRMVAIVE